MATHFISESVETHSVFNEHDVLHRLHHYLPAQAALKDFVHHNTLHAFQQLNFHEALQKSSQIFGYKTYLSLDEFRSLYHAGKIREDVLEKCLLERKGKQALAAWSNKLLRQDYPQTITSRVGNFRNHWKSDYKISLDKIVHPFLFRFLSAYLDQGISIWPFPVRDKGLMASVREIEENGLVSIFRTERAKALLADKNTSLASLLKIVVGRENLFEQYLFDQQFAHPGWSGIVSVIEHQPETLLDRRIISLHDLIFFELLLEIDALDHKFEENWLSLGDRVKTAPEPVFAPLPDSEVLEVLSIWQDAYEWSYYDDVLKAISIARAGSTPVQKSFQGLFCIDDREYSLRRYVESLDEHAETFGTPGFFGVEFYFQPEDGKFFTKACPAPVNPAYLIKEEARRTAHQQDAHYTKRAHLPLQGWLITQTLGFWSALKLFLSIFKPTITPATAYSFHHMDKHSRLTIESAEEPVFENGLQLGFTVEEMATRVGNTLRSIGLVKDFAPIVYLIGHGASSVNNTHYAGYDCGACCGRPGAVNARVFSYMANHPKVRAILKNEGILITEATQFLGAMHDTTRDEIEYYDECSLSAENAALHQQNALVLEEALALNARERSRRFETVHTGIKLSRLHKKVRNRSVSLFEPRPELNHATNSLCIIGRAAMTRNIFLDRRPFMNSYDYRNDPEGKYLLNILNAAAPVCGGINLEYYFSRVDQMKLGAGTKLPHNVIGLFGVANGVEGDLRPGLPSQMIEVHDPIRILFVVEHIPEIVLKTIQRNPATYEWFINEWVQLAVKDPATNVIYHFKEGNFIPYQPLRTKLEEVETVESYIKSYSENIPVILTK